MTLSSEDIRKRYLTFFQEHNHAVIPSASIIPENDPSVLFTTAGMQPLVPYLLGENHPQGNRLVNYQKCVRTNDIDEVGDKTHLTFFEMLGNWSLGDYFKKESLSWSYTLLTNSQKGFGLDPERLYITVFGGNDVGETDTDSVSILTSLGVPEHRIYYLSDNWWPTIEKDDTSSGPTGPDVEFFYDVSKNGLGDLTPEAFCKADDRQEVVEIWNNVFMEYKKEKGVIAEKSKQKNVDTGMGLERITTVIQGKDNVFDTDLFQPLMDVIEKMVTQHPEDELRRKRIIADHIRAVVFMISDGITPSNTDAGYIARRLIRRALRSGDVLGISHGTLAHELSAKVVAKYSPVYPVLENKKSSIIECLSTEEHKFRETLEGGIKAFKKYIRHSSILTGEDAFKLFSTYGLPIDIIVELAKEKGVTVDIASFERSFKEHQEKSRTGAEGKFKGGLAGTGDYNEVRLHTATHLLNAALQEVLGSHVKQKGSNITSERLRFDFSHPQKLSNEERLKVEELVNASIQKKLPVYKEEISYEEALETGARGVFEDSYGEYVHVYTIGDKDTGIVSRELCGGPHVENTAELGQFKLVKEESVSAGVRRIKGVLE